VPLRDQPQHGATHENPEPALTFRAGPVVGREDLTHKACA
jgi:hypothetical protein